MTKILVVDDDLALSDILAFAMRRGGYEVVRAYNGLNALEQFAKEHPDLIVLDWRLPHLDGLDVCTRIRMTSDVPIIMLTVRDSDDNVVAALEAGADDYMVKPFSPRLLMERVRALLWQVVQEPEDMLQIGKLTLDTKRRELHGGDGKPVYLTRLETRLLRVLMNKPDQVIQNDSLTLQIWGPEGATNDMLRQLVLHVRDKLEQVAGLANLLETLSPPGYVLNTTSSVD
ncbi:MAG TPA: response regulator transcription factor [Anaerolineales bacterium]|nr:response regulator transcription factor [Anaerolineales bacterium]